MAYDENLAERIRVSFQQKQVLFVEKKMMGGLCFMVNDKMCVGIVKNMLMARIGPEVYEKALLKEGCKEMTFTGKPMKGYVFVEPTAIDMDNDLDDWLKLSLDYNPKAKASKKKRK